MFILYTWDEQETFIEMGEKIDVWLFSFKIKSNAERILGQKGESAMSFGILI